MKVHFVAENTISVSLWTLASFLCSWGL